MFILKILLIPVTHLLLVVQKMIIANIHWIDDAKWNMLLRTIKVNLQHEMMAYQAYLMVLNTIMICMTRWGTSLRHRGEHSNPGRNKEYDGHVFSREITNHSTLCLKKSFSINREKFKSV
jgi:ABC-type uncharacterized transport system permease subunit